MMDDDDLTTVIITAPIGGSGPAGGIVSLISLAVILIVACVVAGNKDECSKRHCPDQQTPKLMNHECLCVTAAKP